MTQPLIEQEEGAYGVVYDEGSACASADMSLETLSDQNDEENVVRVPHARTSVVALLPGVAGRGGSEEQPVWRHVLAPSPGLACIFRASLTVTARRDFSKQASVLVPAHHR